MSRTDNMGQPFRRLLWIIAIASSIAFLAIPYIAYMEGTRLIYPAGDDPDAFRANIEWRTSFYGDDLLRRRTLLKVYAQEDEYILLGSSGVGVDGTPDNGDIRVFNPGLVTGPIGNETIPDTPSFSCVDQREATGENLGRIGSRAEELAGPNTADNDIPSGYEPCVYQAPETGIYNIVFWGPAGGNSNAQNDMARFVDPTPENLGPEQSTSVTAWGVTVRSNLNEANDSPGRLFTDYFALYTGGNGRSIRGTVYVVTDDGFQYAVSPRSADGNGFIFYSNKFGFINTDGTPLYRDVLADPTLPPQDQNQLVNVQGGITLQRPEYPMFLQEPDPLALDALGIPRQAIPPRISDLTFTGSRGDNVTNPDEGGEFSFTSNTSGVYYIVISRDGVDFDPNNPQNRVLRGVLDAPGNATINWDGRDNTGTPFPPTPQPYLAKAAIQNGEVHFPSLDVENNLQGTQVQLINPPGSDCSPLTLADDGPGCFRLFYDDRGYRTANGELVGVSVNGPLCEDRVGNPPEIPASDPIFGFDSRTQQRGWGFPSGGNPNTSVCDPRGGFGDKKGLDQWTFYPSEVLQTRVQIVDPTAIVLDSFTTTRQGSQITVRWETSAEIDTWGYNVYRSMDGTRATAVSITPELIPAQGRGQGGAAYVWVDRDIQPEQTYTYWLQEVELNGTTSMYGPATSIIPTTQSRIMFPLIIR